MNVKAENPNILLLLYDKMWEKELVQGCLDALHHSGYRTETELLNVDNTKYIAVKVIPYTGK